MGRKPNCRIEKSPILRKKEMSEQEFLEMAKAKYAEIHALNEAPTFLDYEQGFVELWTELGRQVAQANLGARGEDRRKKKIKSTLGTLHLDKAHKYIAKMQHNFAISPLLQSHVLEFSNEQPFDRAMALLRTALPAVDMGSSQSQRLMQYYGELTQTEEVLTNPGFDFETPKSEEEIAPTAPVLYVQVDGGHLPTDDGYRETKVGRIFAGHHIVQKSSDNEQVILRNELAVSDYLAHLGTHTEFTARFDALVNAHLQQVPGLKMIAISDGAEWIANWLRVTFPCAILILDFYHATEHLAEFAKLVFTSKANRTSWIDARKKELLEGELDQVIAAIAQKANGRRNSIATKANELTAYYENNSYRMKYNEYLAAGYCIGSGAIESAISTVVQQRCKLVGQRWTKRVAAVLNIRAVFKSGKRGKLRAVINSQMGWTKAA